MNVAFRPDPDDYVNPFAGLDKLVPPRKRRVVPPSSAKVAAARLAFCEAKRAAVECPGNCEKSGRLTCMTAAHAALGDWIAAEREERAK